MKLSAIAMESIPGDLLTNLKGLESNLMEQANKEVDLCIFPELNLSGTFATREEVDEFLKQNSDPISTCRHLSEKYHIAFTSGWPVVEHDRFYIAQFLFEKGEMVGFHKKTHLAGKEVQIFTPADRIDVFRCNGAVIGLQLCLESHFPEISAIQAQKGAQILAIGFSSPRESGPEKLNRFLRFLPARAYDNNCFVVAANQSGENPSGHPFAGISLICGPKGEVMSQSEHPTHPVTSDLDLNHLKKIKESSMGWFNDMKRDIILSEQNHPSHKY